MAIKDLTTLSNYSRTASGLMGSSQSIIVKCLGADFTGASTDNHRVAKVGKGTLVKSMRPIVVNLDNSATSVDVGIEDSDGDVSATQFTAAMDVNAATGVLATIENKAVLFDDDGYIVVTPNDTFEADTEFYLVFEVELLDVGNTNTALTDPLVQ